MSTLYFSLFDQTNQNNITYFINFIKPFWNVTKSDHFGLLEMSTLTGLTACAISSLCFGSMYVVCFLIIKLSLCDGVGDLAYGAWLIGGTSSRLGVVCPL